MSTRLSFRQRYRRIRYFFPVQLLALHIKKNHFLLFFWLLLFGFTSGFLASRFGVPQQFLVPEYRGATGMISFGIVGFALGGFITAYNLYTYIMHGYRFPFIATLSKPFHKFSINNFALPLFFIVTYTVNSAIFQMEKEFIPPYKVALNILSFISGIAAFQSLSYFYFLYTNKDAKDFGKGKKRRSDEDDGPVQSPIHNTLRWWRARTKRSRWHVEIYVFSFRRLQLARESQHYSKQVLEKVFSQNHVNAARFELVLVISFLIIGTFRENPFFVIPAAASALLFFTMLLMLVSAIHSWTRGWTLTLFIGLMLVMNYFYSDLKVIRLENRAYGMNYKTTKAFYEPLALSPDSATIRSDMDHTLLILDRWRKRLEPEQFSGLPKPKLVVIVCSGGGSRSAFWTMRSLAFADSICQGRLLGHTTLMTGASGGMVGASYLRELQLQTMLGNLANPYDTAYAEKMAQDLLNPIILSMTVNDWFIRYQQLRDGDYVYTKDRAWAFEKELGENTDCIFDKRMKDYQQPEENALIPMMILSPTIVNDGRRLMISPQPISYLTQPVNLIGDRNPRPEDIEYRRLFKDQDPDNLRFITALRMNATFPYILPMATLPSEPPMEVMDAGMRDNFGLKTTFNYLYTFKNWINTNTSGVIIVQVRDLPKGVNLEEEKQSLFSRFGTPLGSIYGNMTKTQDYNNQEMIRYLNASFENGIDLVTFELHQDIDSQISLSWHLTQSERKFIRSATKNEYFLEEIDRLKQLLTIEPNAHSKEN